MHRLVAVVFVETGDFDEYVAEFEVVDFDAVVEVNGDLLAGQVVDLALELAQFDELGAARVELLGERIALARVNAGTAQSLVTGLDGLLHATGVLAQVLKYP